MAIWGYPSLMVKATMSNREAYQRLLAEYGITQAESAAMICEQTQRPCSVRTIRSWLNDPDKPSSRECPDWALAALTNAIARRGEAPNLVNSEWAGQPGYGQK